MPDGGVKCIKVRVKDAPVGSDVCTDNSSHVNSLTVERNLSRVKEKHLTEALVVIT